QERHHPYAGYDGMVEMVRQIDRALSNPVWAAVREPAPWDAAGELHAKSAPSLAQSDVETDRGFARTRKRFATTGVDEMGEC
ncbi:hypothetical protein QR509_26330, partial [Escherichia coli]|uniref:hypothetical protein n=1 Tax=Escherichia coli TaxID=562 RepID=UPI00276BD20B|nr:hypothetical protein [Escherichia coli]